MKSLFFSEPIIYDDEGRRNLASYLKAILLVALVVLPVYVFLKISHARSLFPSDYIIIGLEVIFTALFYLLKKSRVILSGVLFLLTAWIALTVLACYADGIQDIAIVGYILIIFLATLLIGIRFASVITAMSIVSVWILGVIQMENVLIPVGDEALNYSRDYTVIFILVLTAIILFAKSYRNSLSRINKELSERVKAEEELSKNEKKLKEKNEELLVAKEKAEESDRLKTAFIQNISHEIRTPMNGIVGFVELLQQAGSDNEKKAEYVEIINSCTNQLAEVVNDLIDISKIESGTLELNISESETDIIVKDLDSTFSNSARGKGLDYIITNDLRGVIVRSDLGKIKQILNNLVSNAIKFTPKGSVSVKITRLQDSILFSVNDTGIGVREADKKMIFDRFQQAETELSRSYGGSGLGLAISKGNVEFLGGKIWFESQTGRGSQFNFSIPVEFLSRVISRKKYTPVTQFTRGLKILVVEDDEINFLYVKELLVTSNCAVTWARDGFEAIGLLKRNSDYDIILMDLKMPVMNGFEAAKKIKSFNPEIPVIAVTAFSLHSNFEDSAGTDFAGHVIKPIEKNELLAKISSVLK